MSFINQSQLDFIYKAIDVKSNINGLALEKYELITIIILL